MSSTTLAKRSISPAATTKPSKKFVLRPHYLVGLFFGVIAISPTWLFLLVPNLATAVRNTYGAQNASVGIDVILFGVVLMAVVAVTMTKAKEEAK